MLPSVHSVRRPSVRWPSVRPRANGPRRPKGVFVNHTENCLEVTSSYLVKVTTAGCHTAWKWPAVTLSRSQLQDVTLHGWPSSYLIEVTTTGCHIAWKLPAVTSSRSPLQDVIFSTYILRSKNLNLYFKKTGEYNIFWGGRGSDNRQFIILIIMQFNVKIILKNCKKNVDVMHCLTPWRWPTWHCM